MLGQPAVFLDRDGVINVNRPDYVKTWAEFSFLPGSLQAMSELTRLGWPVYVISNQSAIGRGLVSAESVAEINNRMVAEVTKFGGRIDGIYVCPHLPEDDCSCRKPRPGLLLEASQVFNLTLNRSYLVGDAESDILAALAVGAQPVLVLSGRGQIQRRKLAGEEGKIQVVKNLSEATAWILSRES